MRWVDSRFAASAADDNSVGFGEATPVSHVDLERAATPWWPRPGEPRCREERTQGDANAVRLG
jgi:hypothetical protein